VETQSPTEGEKPTEGEGDWLDCEESMGQGSMGFDYCQEPVLSTYHSNETGASRVIGRSWREFGSLVRQRKSQRAHSLHEPQMAAPPGSARLQLRDGEAYPTWTSSG
jgi:hypothetical protein